MKALLTVFALASLFFFSSCTTLHFQQVQPAGVADEKEFDNEIIGSYKYTEKANKGTPAKTIILTIDRTKLYLDGDSIFVISPDNILRKYDGRYFISGKVDSSSTWEVYYLKPVSGGIKIGMSNGKNESEIVPATMVSSHYTKEQRINISTDSLGKSHSDTTYSYILNPDKEELSRLIKKGGFVETKKLKRAK